MGASSSSRALAESLAESLGCAPVRVDYDTAVRVLSPPREPAVSRAGWAGMPPPLLLRLLSEVERAPRDASAVGPRFRAAAFSLLSPRSAFRLVCRAWRDTLDDAVVSLRPRELHAESLANFAGLLTLDLSRVPYPSLPELAKCLVLLPQLRTLRARDNGAGHLLAATLASALAHPHCKLAHLDLAENHVDDRGACALAQALLRNRTLETLVLRDNGINDRGVAAIAASLHACALRSLDLSANGVGAEAAAAVAHALSASPPPPLASLLLTGCGLGDAGARVLGDALPRCAALRQLSLGGCGLRDAGAEALARGLRHSALRRLELSGNDVGDAGARALAAALGGCGLEQLELSDCVMGAEGARALAAAATAGACSVRLDLSPLGEEEWRRMLEAAGGRLRGDSARGARREERPWRPHAAGLLVEDSGLRVA